MVPQRLVASDLVEDTAAIREESDRCSNIGSDRLAPVNEDVIDVRMLQRTSEHQAYDAATSDDDLELLGALCYHCRHGVRFGRAVG